MAPSHGRATATVRDYEVELGRACASYIADPLGFVLAMYDWPIQGEDGPDTWQREVLEEIGAMVVDRGYDPTTAQSVKPMRKAISSGNGCGKTALFAWLVDWLMSTRINTRGTVTANTTDQLDKKTWAAVIEWTKRCRTGHWFEINGAIMYRKGYRATWFCAPISCAPENADAYQGQHARGSASWYLFDEASGIPQTIWDAAEGGLTDEPFIIVGGNPLRVSGAFWQACFGAGRERWNPTIVDTRTSALANQALIADWLEEHGEDGDFFRVHVRGLPPRGSDLQFIDQDRVFAAQEREVVGFDDEPLIVGVDFSGGGGAWNVVRFRRGMDARTIPPIRVPGAATRGDRSAFLSVLAGLLRERAPGKRVAFMYCDTAYGGPYVALLKSMGFSNVMEVTFGATTSQDEKHYANMRAFMWGAMRDWLLVGAIAPKDQRLANDLTAPGHHLDQRDRTVIESKESMARRNVASPDDGDALALTFAAPVAVRKALRPKTPRQRFQGRSNPQRGGRTWMH